MDGFQFNAQHPGDGFINLVPGQALVIGDLEGLADGMGIAHKAHIALGKVRVVGHGPEGGTVAVDDDLLPLQHPLENSVAALAAVDAQGHIPVVVGVAGPDDGHGELMLPVGLHQHLLAGDLVPGVLPVGIGQGGALGDAVVHDGLVVGGGGADVEVLTGLPLKQPDVPLHLLRNKADELTDTVKVPSLQNLGYGLLVVDVRLDPVGLLGHFGLSTAPIQQMHLPAHLHQKTGDGHADGAGAAD